MTRSRNDSTEMVKSQSLPDNYQALLQELKQRIRNRSCEHRLPSTANWCSCTGGSDGIF
jgi:hypothetical protein